MCKSRQIFFTCYLWPSFSPRSFLDDKAIHYVLLFLWMTSCFHMMKEIGRIKGDTMFCPVRQVAAPGVKSAVSHCVLRRVEWCLKLNMFMDKFGICFQFKDVSLMWWRNKDWLECLTASNYGHIYIHVWVCVCLSVFRIYQKRADRFP